MEEVWNAIHTAEKRKERNGTSTPPLDQQQTVGSFLQSIGAIDFGAGDSGIPSGLPSLPSGFLPPAPELQVGSEEPHPDGTLAMNNKRYAAFLGLSGVSGR